MKLLYHQKILNRVLSVSVQCSRVHCVQSTVCTFICYRLQLKDLKRQLHAERKRAEKLQERLQEVLSENKSKSECGENSLVLHRSWSCCKNHVEIYVLSVRYRVRCLALWDVLYPLVLQVLFTCMMRSLIVWAWYKWYYGSWKWNCSVKAINNYNYSFLDYLN